MPTTTRRAQQRESTRDEIKRAALEQVATEGAGALSIRGVARAIGMSPAGLYRYYDGLDDLLTELIADAYNDLADAVAALTARPGPALPRLRAGMLAYRRWALDNPHRFLLVFGTPIPGYAAPEGGPTVQANQRIGEAFLLPLVDGWRDGEVDLPAPRRRPTPGERAFAEQAGPGFPPQAVGTFLSAWAHFHGMVTLEVLGQLDWVYPDARPWYEAEVDRMLDGWRRE
ncbi:MAG: TetR/AcrR family transcriptional regulator [Candidatus Nanopelagicales bacterium]